MSSIYNIKSTRFIFCNEEYRSDPSPKDWRFLADTYFGVFIRCDGAAVAIWCLKQMDPSALKLNRLDLSGCLI